MNITTSLFLMKPTKLIATLFAATFLVGCVNPQHHPHAAACQSAESCLEQAGKKNAPADFRIAHYLESAAQAGKLLSSPQQGQEAKTIYNRAVAELVVLLSSPGNEAKWNHNSNVAVGNTNYRLRFTKGNRRDVLDPGYFTSFAKAEDVPLKTITRRNAVTGVGGTLVGVRKTNPSEPFSATVGITSPVTALLDFKGRDAVLTLVDPTVAKSTTLAGTRHMLAADFSAPLAYYPHKSELWEGIMGALDVTGHMKTTGLYMLEPYRSDRIPLIFVHGLISTPRMWRNVINELETDPLLREKYQCWVFGYPTGNPPAYSAMRLREELAKARRLHPDMKNYVLVGHSMGGLLSRMQTTTFTRESWNVIGRKKADALFSAVRKGDIVDRCTIFNANPHVSRVVFICTPHRGSDMAAGSLGELAMKLISIPADLTSSLLSSMGDAVSHLTGESGRMPNSITGLSPRNPALKVLDSRPIEAPYHSIVGDRGKNDTPSSSDGVVDYWSSHLARARSEKIVPGPHGACELPETLDELRRILREHAR